MRRTKAIILGLLTILPFLFYIYFIYYFLSFYAFLFSGPSNNSPNANTFNEYKIIFPLYIFTILLTVILLIIYICDVYRNKAIEPEKRSLWAIVIFLGNIIFMPIYWYKKIWKPISAITKEETNKS